MTTLGINLTSQDPITCGHSLPSGRFNLVSQQRPAHVNIAEQTADNAYRAMLKAADDYEDGQITREALSDASRYYDQCHLVYLQRLQIWHDSQSFPE